MKERVAGALREMIGLGTPLRFADYACIAFVLGMIGLALYGVYEMLFDPTMLPHIVD